jgi:hypothetical protein
MADHAMVAVPVTAGVVVHMGDHAFREGDTLNLPPAHAAELQAHFAAAAARHEAATARPEAAAAAAVEAEAKVAAA